MAKYTRREDLCCTKYATYLKENKIPFMRLACEIPTTRMAVINRLKREGFQAGYPDYVIIRPFYKDGIMIHPGLCVEMKHEEGNMPTKNSDQHKFLTSMALQGYVTYVTRGADIAQLVTERYLTTGEYSHLYDINIPRNGIRKCLARCYNILIKEKSNELL